MSDSYLTFREGAQLYALPTAAVWEVIRLSAVARVPQGPKALLGVANLRGAVVPVVGLRELLGQGTTPDLSEKLALVLDQATPTALVVDAIDTLESVSASSVESGHKAWDGQETEKLQGAFKIERTQQVAKILDIDSLLKAAFAQIAGETRSERKERAIARGARQGQQAARAEMLVTFQVAGQEFALPLDVVEEILPAPPSVTTISKTDGVIVGFTAVRDSLLPLLSLRGLLGFAPPLESTDREKVVVLRVGGSPIGLVTDAARSVVAADLDDMEAVPPVLAARTGGEARIKAVYRADAGRRLISVLSPDHLFREDVMQRLAAIQPTERRGGVQSKSHAAEESIFLVFHLGSDAFGLPIDSVVEVAQVPSQITRIPKTPKFLEGVVNLRGEVLPVIDQRRRFDMPKLEQAESRRLIVLKTDHLKAAIIVDSVSEVLRTTVDAISPPPQLTAQISRLVHGVVNLENSRRLVLLLDPAELLTRTEQTQLDTFQTQSKKVRD
ncbi:MAG TPA: chemotaxis protein CheW [Steroidobacteraceae bacterium]|jgi:purine-binding chemotaxis protein CheW